MPKRKATDLENGAEAPRRSSRRLSTANKPPEIASKPAPAPKGPRKTEKDKQVGKAVNEKQEEDKRSVSF